METQRFLVVDDEPDVVDMVSQKFRRKTKSGDFEILFAKDGREALEMLAAEEDIGIVFTDINMPRMDGLALLQQVQERENAPTMIVISAYSDQKNIRSAMNNGAFDFLTKPIDFDDFEATLQKATRHNEQISELLNQRQVAERNEAHLSRYLSPSIARSVAKDADALTVGGERLEATYLFTDLQGFSPLSESTKPQVLVDTLSTYFDSMVKIVFDHKGTLMQIAGDTLQATFGAPDPDPDHAKNAVACALALDKFAQGYMAKMQAKGVPLGKTRIGINTGEAVIGKFGGAYFFSFSVHGFPVILAARLEGANKVLGTRICISQATVDQCPGFQGRPVGDLVLRGASSPQRAYEPFHEEQSQDAFLKDYVSAFELMDSADPQAQSAFANLVSQNPDDPVTKLHLSRLLGNQTGAILEA